MNVKYLAIMGLVALTGIIGISMTMNNIDVPEIVKNAFAQKYPAAQKVEWEMEETDEYEAEFKLNGEEISANFKKDGTWLGTETEMDKADLPQAVKDSIAATFPEHEIEEAERCEKPNGVIAYEVELENEKNDLEFKAIFSADGQLIKKEMEEEEDNN